MKRIRIRIGPRTTRAELGAIVCSKLRDVLGDHPVLVGGAAVSIYTRGQYRSDDLDIVTYRDDDKIRPLMEELGFTKRGKYWNHPRTRLFVEFLGAPPMVGKKYISNPDILSTRAGDLPIVSVIDSACDRLMWYLSGDNQSLQDCAKIVIAQGIDLADLEARLADESYSEKQRQTALSDLRQRVNALKKRRRHRS